MLTRKLATAAVTGVLSLAVTGSAAFAAFQPGQTTAVAAATDTAATTTTHAERQKPERKHGLKEILERLVQNGTITQAQAEAILKAFKEAGERKDKGHDKDRDGGAFLKRVMADLMKVSVDYIGLPKEAIGGQLKSGKSLGEIANTQPGKSREGLIAFDVAQVTAQLDKAVADGKITQEQADRAKAHLVENVTRFVDHKHERRPKDKDRDKGKHPRPEPERKKPTATPTT